MIGEELPLFVDRWSLIVNYFISQPFNSFSKLFFRPVSIHLKTHIAANKIHFYFFLPLFFKVAGNGQSTIGAIHTFNPPFNFFHPTKLFYEILNQLLMKENIFATWR